MDGKRLLAFLTAVLICLAIAGCSSHISENTMPATSNIKSLSFINTDDQMIKVGESTSESYVKAEVQDKNDFSPDEVFFYSENPDIATIEFTKDALTTYLYYRITGVSAGETYVYASDKEGSIISEKVKVVVEGNDLVDGLNNKDKIEAFFAAFIDRAGIENIEELANEYGVFSDYKNTGVSVYYKIAPTKEEANVVGLGDLYQGTYYVVVNPGGESVVYFNDVEMIEIEYSDEAGFAIYDKCRLTPFEDGQTCLHVDTVAEALSYKSVLETDLSPIEQFYTEARIGMSKDELQQLLLKYNLQMKYRRSNSDDGYISFGEMSVNGYTTYISFVMRDRLTELNFYDYYVQTKYGLSIVYIGEDQTSSGSGSYEKAGYYIVGGETPIYFPSASEAINELHSNRMK